MVTDTGLQPERTDVREPDRRGVPWYRSLRLQIAVAVAIVSLVTAVSVSALLSVRAAADARDALRDQALERVAAAAEGYAIDGRLRFGVSLDPELAPEPLRAGLAVGGRASYFDGEVMWAAQRLGPDVLLTTRLDATSLKEDDASRMATLGTAGLLAVSIASLLGWLSANRLSRRLRRAAAAADRIASGDGDPQDQRVERVHDGGHDEVAILTRAIDAMADSLRQRLDNERSFTVDVAHELRTPVTGLVSAVELLPPSEATSLVRRQVERVRRLVEALLEISRLDAGRDAPLLQRIDLHDAVAAILDDPPAGVVYRSLPNAEPSGDPRQHQVWADLHWLGQLLSHLVGNALRHGAPPVVVRVDGHTLEVTDAGPGFTADFVASGPRRFHATGRTKGAGLGLTIAEKQAERMGGTLTIGNGVDGGARVVVTFTSGIRPVPASVSPQEGNG